MNTTHLAPKSEHDPIHPGAVAARTVGGILLAAIVSALVVGADVLVDRYADGHLLLAWLVMWAVAFAALALFARIARRSARRLFEALGAWRELRAQRIADKAFLAAAQRDPRIMAEFEAADERSRAERRRVQLAHGRAWVEHRPVGTLHAAYTGPRSTYRTSPLTGLPTHLQYLGS